MPATVVRDVVPPTVVGRLSLDYGYNAAGDVTSLSVATPTLAESESFIYDNQDRIRKWTAAGTYAFSHEFAYTAGGDRLQMIEDGTTWSYAYTQDHRLTQYSKPGLAATLAYDANGNTRWRNVTQGPTTTKEYLYDSEDRLTTAKQNGATIGSYTYDGLGRRVMAVEGTTTTYFVYSGLSLVYTQATSVTHYIYASGLLVARTVDGVKYYVHQDALGSVRVVTNTAGAIFSSTQYKPFGIQYGLVNEPVGQRLKFTGQWHDAATNMYYLYRRFYDPELGRFLSPDPVLGHLTVRQSLDRYVYTVNNPLRYIDPTGEDWWNPFSWTEEIGKALSAIANGIVGVAS